MRKGLCFLCLAALLCGCGRGGEERFAVWQEAAAGAELSFSARVTASVDGTAWTYAAGVRSGTEETEVTLTEPAALSGLTLRQRGESTLEYDGAVLALPPVAANGDSPAAALPLLCAALRGGRLLSWSKLGEGMEAELYVSEEERLLVVFDGAMTPLSAVLVSRGRAAVTLESGGCDPNGGE